MDYPQYRMYFDGNTIFEIVSNDKFIEIKQIGKYYTTSEIECKLYPEKLFLNDLLSAAQDGIKIINFDQYSKTKKTWEETLIKYEFNHG